MPIFAKNMKEERLFKGISQEKLSKKSGVTQQAISWIETGRSSPTEETMEMIAAGLDCTVKYLLSEHVDVQKEEEDFSPVETQLIDTYRHLTPQGQEYIRQQMEIAKKIYQQSDPVSVLAE